MSTTDSVFQDRADAGRRLAARLLDYRDQEGVIVLGIPGSGVPVARPIADALNAPLDIAISQPDDDSPSRRSGAASRMRDRNSSSGSLMGLGGGWSSNVARGPSYSHSMEEHMHGLDHSERIPDGLMGKTVIVVDYGLHSDKVVHRTLQAIRLAGAAHICLAIPVAAKAALDNHESEVDRIVCLHAAQAFAGAASHYRDHHVPTAAEIEALLT